MRLALYLDDDNLQLDYQIVEYEPFEPVHYRTNIFNNVVEKSN